MATHVVSRPVESRAVSEFLAAAPSGPSALVVEGEAGIGKTTIWLAALDLAQLAGFRVLSTRATSAESVRAYTSLAALLAPLDDAAFAELPPPQRLAVDRVLMRVSDDGPVTDQRAVGAAFLSVVERLAAQSPVLIAIDDLQWLDEPSRLIISSVMRRLTGPVGVFITLRDEPEHVDAAAWLELRRPDRLHRVRVRPLSMGATHTVLAEQLGRTFSRPKLHRIHELSGGNPFYAVELGRAMEGDPGEEGAALPTSLADLVRARLAALTVESRDALLAAACLATATLELIARATNTNAERIMAMLEEAENNGIVQIDGNRVVFAHPLLSRGVYSGATPARRRAMHRRLAKVVDEPELKARHLALAAASGDDRTLRSLDTAAEIVRTRGAPAAAAELLDLARGLGGDTPERRIRAAAHHYDAGDPARARSLLDETIARLTPGALLAEACLLSAAIKMYDDSFIDAAAVLERALAESVEDGAIQVRMEVMLAYALFNSGRLQPALQRADDAVANASLLGQPELLGQALGMRATLRFVAGEGLDEADMRRARELADYPLDLPLATRPAVQSALLLAWTGKLDQAAGELAVIRERCVGRGEESELIFVGFHSALVQVWRGNLAEAELIGEDTMELALQLGGDLPLFIALTIRAMSGAYAGRVDEVRREAQQRLPRPSGVGLVDCLSGRLPAWDSSRCPSGITKEPCAH